MARSQRRIRLASVFTIALAAVASLVVTASPAVAVPQQLVALGDSYSAGVGTRDKQNDCYQSPSGYPVLVAQRGGYDLAYEACSGAKTADVTNKQLGALSPSTSTVTMTIGGNDVGFAPVLVECAKPGWMSDCNGAIAKGRAVLENELPGRYDALFGLIRQGAPSARVAVGAYPRLFNGEDCNLATFFSPSEQAELNRAVDDLASLVQTKAGASGFDFVDPRAAFQGHAVCDSAEWVNGLSNPIEESYHPNVAGNAAYADLFGAALGVMAAEDSYSTTPFSSPQSSDAETATSSARDEADRVLALGIDSEENLVLAAESGIDPASIRDIAERLRAGDDAAIRDALAQLQALDVK